MLSNQPALIDDGRFNVGHTSSEQQQHPREIIAKGKAIVSGQEFPLGDWNPVASMVEDRDLDRQPNDTVPLRFSVPATEPKNNVSCHGYVRRVDRSNGRLVVMFSALSKATQRVIDAHSEQLMA